MSAHTPPGTPLTEKVLQSLCHDRQGIPAETLEAVLTLAVEIAREGREGRKIGTLFTVGHAKDVLERSHPLILDPLAGHPASVRHVGSRDMRETIKELAQLDGGFVISSDGVVLSAARFFDASSEGVDVPMGLGSRHMAGASISKATRAVAVVVSESSVVRLFDDGHIASEIIPELWMLRRYGREVLGEDASGAVVLMEEAES